MCSKESPVIFSLDDSCLKMSSDQKPKTQWSGHLKHMVLGIIMHANAKYGILVPSFVLIKIAESLVPSSFLTSHSQCPHVSLTWAAAPHWGETETLGSEFTRFQILTLLLTQPLSGVEKTTCLPVPPFPNLSTQKGYIYLKTLRWSLNKITLVMPLDQFPHIIADSVDFDFCYLLWLDFLAWSIISPREGRLWQPPCKLLFGISFGNGRELKWFKYYKFRTILMKIE